LDHLLLPWIGIFDHDAALLNAWKMLGPWRQTISDLQMRKFDGLPEVVAASASHSLVIEDADWAI
jgi:hypothetical protein